MELAPNPNAPQELPPKKSNPPSTKSNPKDTPPTSARRAKRRRAAATNADFNVNFSKIKISESNRVLRSRSKCSTTFSLDNSTEIPQCAHKEAVSKDHSYSKASRRSSKVREPTTSSPPTVHLKVFIDLTSTEDGSCECLEEGEYALPGNKIEIIDFDDLELSNDSKFEYHSNGPQAESRHQAPMPEQTPVANMNPGEPLCRGPNHDRKQSQNKPSTGDQDFNPKPDFEQGNTDPNVAKDGPLPQQPQDWMLEPSINPNNVMEPQRLPNNDTSPPPVYLDLDQNCIEVSGPQTIRQLTRLSDGVMSPINFPSGGCFQRLPTGFHPNSGTSRAHQSLQMPANQCEWSSDNAQPPLTGFPNFQTVFAHKIASLKHSNASPPDTMPNPLVESNLIPSSFSTSGGSVERILSPVIPRQPTAPRNHHCIAVSFDDTHNAVANLVPEPGQQPECRIHLVDTPPSFTRPSQTEPRSPSEGCRADGLVTQQEASEFDRNYISFLRLPCKPKRTRRTRAQMEICRQEMARNCSHRSRRNHRFTSRNDSHIFDRNFSLEYRRVQNTHPQDFIYSGLPTRCAPYLRQAAAVQQQRYAETYSVNETNLFGVALSGSDWSQTFDSLPSFSHAVSAFRSFEPLWTMSPGSSFSSTEVVPHHRQFHIPPAGNVPNPSSFMWNQQVRSIQMQSAFGNVQHVAPAVNPQILVTGRRSFTPWQLEHLSSNLADVPNIGSLNSMQFY